MKRVVSSLVVVLMVVAFASLALAAQSPKPSQEAAMEIKYPPAIAQCAVKMIGKVESINKKTNEVVITDQEDNAKKTIVVKPEDLKKIKVGKMVMFGLSEGSNKVEALEVVKKEKPK